MKWELAWILTVVFLCVPNGCAWLDYQETKLYSGSLYTQVDAEVQNFGYQRLMINCRYRKPVDDFVKKRGIPEFIYEYNKGPREGIRLYYMRDNEVYDFIEQGTRPDSATLVDQRPMTSFEKAYLNELKDRQPL